MRHSRISLTVGRQFLIVTAVLFLFGCSLPRIIVLHDPLTANEHGDLGRATSQRGSLISLRSSTAKRSRKTRSICRPFFCWEICRTG
jgi:hypothetical protein